MIFQILSIENARKLARYDNTIKEIKIMLNDIKGDYSKERILRRILSMLEGNDE